MCHPVYQSLLNVVFRDRQIASCLSKKLATINRKLYWYTQWRSSAM